MLNKTNIDFTYMPIVRIVCWTALAAAGAGEVCSINCC